MQRQPSEDLTAVSKPAPVTPAAALRKADSALIVRVPEAEACVGELRHCLDASARLGVPAHITLLFPFMPSQRITGAVLRQAEAALAEVPAFSFRLHEVARFPATAYLAPEPEEPFIALTAALVCAFPAYPPFRGEHAAVVPHLTVANGNAEEAEAVAAELTRPMQAHGPIVGRCSHVTLMENEFGTWRDLHAFALPQR